MAKRKMKPLPKWVGAVAASIAAGGTLLHDKLAVAFNERIAALVVIAAIVTVAVSHSLPGTGGKANDDAA